jgi:phospholipase/carboxylesterase
MARSMLIYQELPQEASACPATLVALHGRGGDVDQLVPLWREVGPSFQLVAPQAARPVNPATQGYSSESQGFTWYFIEAVGRPEPATFGEGLWLVEQFIYDVKDRQSPKRPIFLLGYEQGAVLAATLAGVLPELLAGVVGICGYLPEIRGWSLPVENLERLPVLLVHDPDDSEIPIPLVQRTAEELDRRSATVELREFSGARQDPRTAAEGLRDWLDAQLAAQATAAKHT